MHGRDWMPGKISVFPIARYVTFESVALRWLVVALERVENLHVRVELLDAVLREHRLHFYNRQDGLDRYDLISRGVVQPDCVGTIRYYDVELRAAPTGGVAHLPLKEPEIVGRYSVKGVDEMVLAHLPLRTTVGIRGCDTILSIQRTGQASVVLTKVKTGQKLATSAFLSMLHIQLHLLPGTGIGGFLRKRMGR